MHEALTLAHKWSLKWQHSTLSRCNSVRLAWFGTGQSNIHCTVHMRCEWCKYCQSERINHLRSFHSFARLVRCGCKLNEVWHACMLIGVAWDGMNVLYMFGNLMCLTYGKNDISRTDFFFTNILHTAHAHFMTECDCEVLRSKMTNA